MPEPKPAADVPPPEADEAGEEESGTKILSKKEKEKLKKEREKVNLSTSELFISLLSLER
jgi:hypothetical protein